MGKESICNVGDTRLIPGSGRSLAGGHNNPLQYFCLENPMDREPGGLQSIVLPRVRHDWSDWAHTHTVIPMLLQAPGSSPPEAGKTRITMSIWNRKKWSPREWKNPVQAAQQDGRAPLMVLHSDDYSRKWRGLALNLGWLEAERTAGCHSAPLTPHPSPDTLLGILHPIPLEGKPVLTLLAQPR